MTLPTDIIFPMQMDLIKAGDSESLELYFRNLIETLTDMYQQIAGNVNGSIRQWSPVIIGSTSPGTGTYSYQDGWLRRSGIITELWFDVKWTNHTGTGDVIIQLPYKTAKSSNSPWVGFIQSVSSANIFDAGYTYLVMNATQDSLNGTIRQCGSGVATLAMPIDIQGEYSGYIQYIGQELEN